MKTLTSIISFIIASPVFSEDARQLNAHEHGIGALNIAIEAPLVVMEFHAPGADIVGFEYAAKSDADLAAISAALKTLEAPLDLFVLPRAARCAVQAVRVELESDADHEARMKRTTKAMMMSTTINMKITTITMKSSMPHPLVTPSFMQNTASSAAI